MKKIFVLAGLLASVAALPAAAQSRFTSLVVFGDSFVDSGNVQKLAGIQQFQNQGYYNGRFTNGYDFTDYIANYGFGATDGTLNSISGGYNYAFGGARMLGGLAPDIGAQVISYRLDVALNRRTLDKTGLFVLQVGPNDIFAIERGDFNGNPDAFTYIKKAIDNYLNQVKILNNLGVKNFLLTNAMDANVQYNDYFQTKLNSLNLSAGTNVYQWNFYQELIDLSVHPERAGLASWDTTTKCINTTNKPDCSNYFFFDDVHPTARVHAAVFESLNARFNLVSMPVPEPATWAMMIVGFGMVGASMRRRPKVRTTVAFA